MLQKNRPSKEGRLLRRASRVIARIARDQRTYQSYEAVNITVRGTWRPIGSKYVLETV